MATAAQDETAIERRRPALPAEFDLLVASCQPGCNTDRLGHSLAAPISWEQLLQLAEHHRVVPALYQALHDREDVPGSIQSAIEARFQKNAVKALRFSAELVRVMRAFHESKIEVLAHKGPALAQFLYSDAAMRQYGDLDLLVRRDSVSKARTVLQQLGYELPLKLSPRQEWEYLRSGYEYVFGLGEERNLLELHWQILSRFYAVDFDLDAMFARAVDFTIEGFPARSLARADLMLVLCVHAAKHGWAQLGMLRDIAALSHSDLDWDWIFAEAARLGIRRIVSISLLLVHELLAAPVPANIGLAAERSHASAFAAEISATLASTKDFDSQSLSYFREFAAWREHWRDRTRFWLRLALTPSVGEWQSVRLPDWLFPLYRLVRVFRLFKRFV